MPKRRYYPLKRLSSMSMISKQDFDWRKYLEECLRSTEFCSIATVDPKGVWSNPVYFAWDEKFNLFFILQPRSRHMKNLERDPRVAVSIYSTTQSTFGNVSVFSSKAEHPSSPKKATLITLTPRITEGNIRILGETKATKTKMSTSIIPNGNS